MSTVVKVKGQKLKIERIVEAGSGKVTAVLEGGQEITYRPPAADLIRSAFKPAEKSAEVPAEKPKEKPSLFKSREKSAEKQ